MIFYCLICLVAGMEVMRADMDDAETLKPTLQGAYSVFLVIPQPSLAELDMDKEIRQVRNLESYC